MYTLKIFPTAASSSPLATLQKTNRRIKLLKKLLEELAIDASRVRFEYVSASEGQKFAQVVTEFVDDLKKLGPNPLKEVEA